MPRRAKAPPPRRLLANPFLLALAAVVAAFGIGWLASSLSREPAEPAQVAASVPVSPPPAAKPAVREQPPAPAPVPAPAAAPVEQAAAAAPPPPMAVAALPPPVPPEVPRPAPPGSPPWLRNAVPAKMPPAGHPAIVIVIDDMGVDRRRSNRVVQLPGPLTLAWLPYARELPEQSRAARSRGHELLIHVPMEPSVKADPGPNALLVSLDRPEIVKRMEQAFASFDGYVGINNHMGSRFTADRAGMVPVIAELHRRGLLWLDSRTTPNSAGLALAKEQGVPHLGRDVFLDNEQSVPAIRAELAKLESVARRQGWGVAIGHPHDTTIEALASWLPDAQKRGFTLVPVSAVVRARQAGG